MKMMRLPWKGREMPQATLDILRGCNASCRYCYNQNKTHYKSFEEISTELEQLLQLRRIQMVTISGGEPLLHPDLPRIVRLVRSRGLRVTVLSNGILLDEAMATELADAGCDLVFIHIQTGQRRPDLPDPESAEAVRILRESKEALLLRHHITPCLAVTIENGDRAGITALLREFAASRGFGYLLVTIARDMTEFNRPEAMTDIELAPLLTWCGEAGFEAFSYLGGHHCPEKPRWLVFHAVERRTREGRHTGSHSIAASGLEWAFQRLYRRITGRYPFYFEASPLKIRTRLLLNALTGGKWSALPFALGAILRGEELLDRHVVLELPPVRLPDGRIEFCGDCPDATVVNGKLCPLCLQDIHEELCI